MQNLAKFVCKKMSILLIVIMVGVFPGVGYALSVNPGVVGNCTAANAIPNFSSCKTSFYTSCTANGGCYETCATCPDGQDRIPASSIPASCGVYNCGAKQACNPLTECGTEPLAAWSHYQTGYQSITPYNCDVSTDCKWVKGETEYRCAAGYFGEASCSSSSCSGCTPCPQQHGSSGTVAAGNDKKITDCYKGTSVSSTDQSGTYVFTDTCKYTQ